MNGNDSTPLLKKQKVAAHEDSQSDAEFDFPEYMTSNVNHSAQQDTLYLDTIHRPLLDFDFEKVCSVTLSNTNVYCCLVCGKYFSGRSRTSPSYTHSLENNHHVFINLHNEKYYVLPENYEITSYSALKSLRDINNFLNPKYTKSDIENLPVTARDLDHKSYDVGYVGLNNISANDYSNVVIQALSHIVPIRNWYLSLSHRQDLNERLESMSPLNYNFGILVRKLWSKYLYRNHVSPHEFLQYLSSTTKNQFSITRQSTPKKLLVWLLNNLHLQLSKSIKKSSTVLSDNLRGRIKVTSMEVHTKEVNDKVEFETDENSAKESVSSFWVLTLDLISSPLFMDVTKIQEVALTKLLQKYDGKQTSQVSSSELRTYKLIAPLPRYLIFHIDRGLEKDGSTRGNPTVVQFSTTIDMAPYTEGADQSLNYKLLSTIKRQSTEGVKLDHSDDKNNWAISLRRTDDSWVCIKDLEFNACEGGLLFLEENYLQIWERC
ncbi:hypothetical protein G9P44_004480 [Scheffersomyces stipitis]|nr:hypothetical protein G9P44_004480 [Scheffersomyces stipitis]